MSNENQNKVREAVLSFFHNNSLFWFQWHTWCEKKKLKTDFNIKVSEKTI